MMKTTIQKKKGAEPLPCIHRYQLTSTLTNDNSGFSRWGFAEANGKQYFIKEFLSPKCPEENAELAPDILQRKRAICAAFYKRKRRLYDQLMQCSTGNIVVVQDFFLFGTRYYIVTDRVDTASIAAAELAKESVTAKLRLCKVLAYCIGSLHQHGIVHCDLKPSNILIKETRAGTLTAKLIDFDGSFLVNELPDAADLQGDQTYIAPEVCLAMNGEEAALSGKADIFSLGLIYHEYFTGRLPDWDREYAYAHEALLDGKPLSLSTELPAAMYGLLSAMLSVDASMRPSAGEVFNALIRMESASEPPAPPVPPIPPRPPRPPEPEPVSGSPWHIPKDLDF